MNYNKNYNLIAWVLLLLPAILFGQEDFDKNRIYPAPVGDKAGYIDYTGQFVIPPIYYQTRSFDPDNRAAIVSTETLDGIIDLQGNFLVPMVYNSLKRCKTLKGAYGYYYIASIDKKYGVINLENQIIIPFEYDYIRSESNCFIVKKDGLEGVLNLSNEVILHLEHKEVYQSPYNYLGFIAKGTNNKWALFEEDGKQICNPIFDDRNIDFTPSYINGSSNGESLTIDYYGMVYPNFDFNVFGFYDDNYSIVKTKNELYGLINDNFNWVVKPQYEDLTFNDFQTILFKEEGKWGAMSLSGETLLLSKYEGIIQAGETIFGLSMDDSGYRLYDLANNKWLTTEKYYHVDGDEETGLIEVNLDPDPYSDGIWGMLNFQGEMILEPDHYMYYIENSDIVEVFGPEDDNSTGIYSLEKHRMLIPPVFDLIYYEHNHLIEVNYWMEDSRDKIAYLNHQGEVVWTESDFDVQQLMDDFYIKNPKYGK